MSKSVRDVMQDNVELVGPGEYISEIARKMQQRDCGSIPVGDGDRLAGMITDRDIVLRCVAQGKDPAATTARECMTPDILYIFEDTPVEEALENMGNQAVRRLVVLDENKQMVGIVSLGDLTLGCKDENRLQTSFQSIREAA